MAAMADLGAALAGMGRDAQAESILEEAVRGARGIGAARVEASCLCNLGALRRRSGDPDGALGCLGRALSLARRVGDSGVEAEALLNMANALADSGGVGQAFDASMEALAVLKGMGGSRHLGLALRNAAVFAGDAGSGRQLDRLYAELSEAIGMIAESERPGVLIAAARAARGQGMMLRAAELASAAEHSTDDPTDQQLAAVRAIQAICSLDGGDRAGAEAAYGQARNLAGQNPDADLRADLEELRAELS
jgi:hypothetical protein